jgi:hypothetical protein
MGDILTGTSTLLLGAPGAGKTYSLTTLIEAGLELFVVVTDPGGVESIIDSMVARNLDMDKFHYNYVAPVSSDWKTFLSMAKTMTTLGYKDMAGLKSGVEKKDFIQFTKLIETLNDFVDERTGESFGPVDDWGPDRALVIDSMSGVNVMAMKQMVGAKLSAHQGEWGVAMNAEETLLLKLTSDLTCYLVCTAHIDRIMDETIGKPMNSVALLGNKLAPKIPRLFSDVVLAYRDGQNFFWSTTEANTDLKARSLPLAAKLEPTFKPIVRRQTERFAAATPQASLTETKETL